MIPLLLGALLSQRQVLFVDEVEFEVVQMLFEEGGSGFHAWDFFS
jgi:hypothetical protein